MEKFKRDWELTITPYTKASDGTVTLISGGARTFKELRVVFNVTNTLHGDPCTGNFQLYNIAQRTKTLLATASCFISLKTAYWGRKQVMIFQGEITNSYEIRQGADTVYNIWARDSGRSLDTAPQGLRSYSEEKNGVFLLDKLVRAVPNIQNTVKYIGSAQSALAQVTEDSYNFIGSFRKQITELTEQANLLWHCRFGEVRVLAQEDPVHQLVGDTSPFVVSVSTGLLSRPVVDYVGVKFDHLLEPKFTPDALISIEANTVRRDFGNELYVPQDEQAAQLSGLFRVKVINHKGDTRGDTWKTSVTAYNKVG